MVDWISRHPHASGRVVPHIGATLALDDTAAALRYVAGGRAIGKVVVTIG